MCWTPINDSSERPQLASELQIPTGALIPVFLDTLEATSGADDMSASNRDLEKRDDSPVSIMQGHNNKDTMDKARRIDKTIPELVIVDWDGPDDLESPYNWTPLRKWTAMGAVSSHERYSDRSLSHYYMLGWTYVFCLSSSIYLDRTCRADHRK